jgi:hypothetical protein
VAEQATQGKCSESLQPNNHQHWNPLFPCQAQQQTLQNLQIRDKRKAVQFSQGTTHQSDKDVSPNVTVTTLLSLSLSLFALAIPSSNEPEDRDQHPKRGEVEYRAVCPRKWGGAQRRKGVTLVGRGSHMMSRPMIVRRPLLSKREMLQAG